MYETCKEQYKRKIERGLITVEYIEKQKICIGIFLMSDELEKNQYQELLELLNNNIPNKEINS